MNQNILRIKLQNQQPVYIFDSYEDAVVRLIPSDNGIKVFLKRKNSIEKVMDSTDNIIADILLSGDEISESEYFEF